MFYLIYDFFLLLSVSLVKMQHVTVGHKTNELPSNWTIHLLMPGYDLIRTWDLSNGYRMMCGLEVWFNIFEKELHVFTFMVLSSINFDHTIVLSGFLNKGL